MSMNYDFIWRYYLPRSGKEEIIILPEVKEVMAAMEQYYSELSLLENVIHNWDPIKKTIVVIFLS